MEPLCPRVSVVIPAARVDRWLRDAVASALAQQAVDLEVLVVLDGCVDDGSLPGDERLRVLALPRRCGSGAAINRGIAAARADHIARLDADDLCDPTRTARQLRVLDQRPELVAIGTAARVIDQEGRAIGSIVHPSDPDVRGHLLRRNALVHSSVLMRRSAVEAVGGYDETCVRMQDYELWLRLALIGPVSNLPEALTDYRVHGGMHSRRTSPFSHSARAVRRSRRNLARFLGSPIPVQLLCDTAWTLSQALRHWGLRRPQYLSRSTRGPEESVMARRPRCGTLIVKTDLALDVMLRGQLRFLAQTDLAPVRVAADDTGRLRTIGDREGVEVHRVDMERDPAPLQDALALLQLIRLMHRLRPEVVVYGTPKATLLAGLAARLTGVPTRVQILHCLRLETTGGLMRTFLLVTERLALRVATNTLAVSHDLRDRCAELGLDTSRMDVLGRGSVVGVDVARARALADDPDVRAERRAALGAADQEFVVGFVGRLTRDKGIEPLVRATAALRATGLAVRLALVGPDEGLDDLDGDVRDTLQAPWVTRTGNLADPAPTFTAFDVFCLPSRREGLPTVVLEAWATGVPVVATACTGIAGLVEHDRTGLLVPVDDTVALAGALERALLDGGARDRMRREAQILVGRHYAKEVIWERCARYFRSARDRKRVRAG